MIYTDLMLLMYLSITYEAASEHIHAANYAKQNARTNKFSETFSF